MERKTRETLARLAENITDLEEYALGSPQSAEADAFELLRVIRSELHQVCSPPCGHSACRQNWIDTGEPGCAKRDIWACDACGSTDIEVEANVGVNDGSIGSWCGDFRCNGCNKHLGSHMEGLHLIEQ